MNDAALSQLMNHITQLTPTLQVFQHRLQRAVIAGFQASTWGEWVRYNKMIDSNQLEVIEPQVVVVLFR